MASSTKSQAATNSLPRPLGTNLLDLPPELTEAICMLALSDLSLVERGIGSSKRAATLPICRVNRRLRYESLLPFLQNACFRFWLPPTQSSIARLLANAQRWTRVIAKDNLRHLHFLTLEGYPPRSGSSWKCKIDFQLGILDMADLPGQPRSLFLRWSLKHAFLTITKGEKWRPTAEGMDVFLQTFVIVMDRDPLLSANDSKLDQLKERFPHVYLHDSEMDLSAVQHESGKSPEEIPSQSAPRMYRYVG